MTVHKHSCSRDGSMPENVAAVDIVKVETQTCIGWVDITEDFVETKCGLNYKFHTT